MLKTLVTWCSIAFLLVISPLLHIQIQAFLTTVGAYPAIKALAAQSRLSLGIIFTICNLLSAAFTASITILPSSYLAPKQPTIIAVVFALVLISLPISLFWKLEEASAFATVMMLGELVAIACTAILFARIGTVVGAKKGPVI